jgi:hypothetical protein
MRSAFVVLCSVLLAACGDGYGGSPTGTYPGRVLLTLSSSEVLTSTGDTRSVTAEVTGPDGVVVQAPVLTWTSSAPAVATVTGSGADATITAVDDGVATISATDGAERGVVTVTVHRRLASVTIAQPVPTVAFGSTLQLTATGFDARGHPITTAVRAVFASSDPTTLLVSAEGVVTPLFKFPGLRSAIISAKLTREEATFRDTTTVVIVTPAGFDHGALLLTEGVRPRPVRTLAAGVAFFTVHADRIDYIVTWSGFSGPATSVHLHAPGGVDAVADVLVDLGNDPANTTFGTVKGSFTAASLRPLAGQPAIALDSLVTLMNGAQAYLDVHTAANPDGEVRGQFTGPID